MVDIVPGKAMALDVMTVGGTLSVINVNSLQPCQPCLYTTRAWRERVC